MPIAVVTGASAGAGRAIAHALAQRGFDCGLIARGRAGLEAARKEVESFGVRAHAVACDVADADAVEAAAEAFETALGPIFVWVNAAMVTVLADVAETTAEEYERVTRVTYLGQVHGTRAALARMEEHGRGHIVNVGSALAYRAIPLQSAYCAAKYAVRGFTDSLRSELINENSPVKLTMIQLPGMNTPQFDWSRNKLGQRQQPVPPIYQPEVAGDAVIRALDTGAREVWVGRSSFETILGSILAPHLMDRLLAYKAYAGQLEGEALPADHPDNLFEPADAGRDYGTHGRFDDRAERKASSHTENNLRMLLAALGIGLAGGALYAARRSGR